MKEKLITSESVSEGHPDKLADQISDAILDDILKQDKNARVACETLIKMGMILIAGEINTNAWANLEKISKQVLENVGYNEHALGFDAHSCAILSEIGQQSSEISDGVDHGKQNSPSQGAGDQGIVFGFACNETKELMPFPISYAHKLMKRQSEVRHKRILPWLWPDAKSQVTVKYENNKPVSVDTIIISTQHTPEISLSELREAVIETIIKPIVPSEMLTKETKLLVNTAGKFTIGGPVADCGLTGRKTVVDTYGGGAHHGGGAFSGKDPSKVDRSGAYVARYIAKNVVASGVAERCEIQIAFAIGIPKPIAISINCFGTNNLPEEKILKIIKNNFPLTPYSIINSLNLLRPIYLKTSCYGHFGREDPDFTWEKTDKKEIFLS